MKTLGMRVLLALAALFTFQAWTVIPAMAQLATADVVGTVTDSSGAVIPNAAVALTNTGTGVTATTQTNGTGDYTFSLLIPGQYTVSIQATGFSKLTIPAVHLEAGDRFRADATMHPGSNEETITVASSAPLLQTDSSSVQSTVSEESVQSLPLNGRNYFSLVTLQPGVNQGQSNTMSSGQRPDDRRMGSTVVANGQHDNYNNQLIDGMDNNMRIGLVGVRPSIDGIAEVQVTTSNFSAEYGRTVGAVINVITKSGTNNYHGSLYNYFRNDIFDARSYFARVGVTPKPEYRQNQFGGSIGGPILKRKTFFFVDAEDYRMIQGLSSGNLTVPTLYEEQNPGDFTDIGGPKLTHLDPVGLAYFKMYPAPNISSTATTSNYTSVQNESQYTFTTDARIDHHFNDRNTLWGRYSYNNVSTTVPGWFPAVNEAGLTIQPNGGASAPGPNHMSVHNAVLDYTNLMTPNLIMELKASLDRLTVVSQNLNYGINVSNQLGLIGANTPAAPETTGLATVTFGTGGYAPLGDGNNGLPILDTTTNFSYSLSWLWTHGAHDVKWGAEVTRREVNYFSATAALPSISFTNSTGNSLADMLSGKPFTISRNNTLYFPAFRFWDGGGYLRDNWRYNNRLTLNLGLRYEFYTPETEAHDLLSNFIYPKLSFVTATQDPHVGIGLDVLDFSPRVGFAYSATRSTVLRGAFAVSYFPSYFQTFIIRDPPYLAAPNCANFCSAYPWPNMPLPTQSSTTNPVGQISYNHNRTVYVEQLSLGVQQQIGANVISATGVGVLGRRVDTQGNINIPLPNGPYPNDATAGPSAPPPLLTAAALPNVTTVGANLNESTSNYWGLDTSFARRLSHGLEFNMNYTWAHMQTDGSIGTGGGAGQTFAYDPHYDYGNGATDIRSRFATTLTYAIPGITSEHRFMSVFSKGWNTSLMMFWQTGQVFTVTDAFTNKNGDSQMNVPFVTSDRPDHVPGVSYAPPSGKSLTNFINLAAFTPQQAGTLGNEKTFQLEGPHLRRADLSLFKDFKLHEALTAEFRAEAYNISNTPNFLNPNATITGWKEGSGHSFLTPIRVGDSGYCTGATAGCTAVGLLPGDVPTNAGNFGVITGVATNMNPRQFQFALRIMF